MVNLRDLLYNLLYFYDLGYILRVELSENSFNSTVADMELIVLGLKDLLGYCDEQILERAGFKAAQSQICALHDMRKIYVGADRSNLQSIRDAIAKASSNLLSYSYKRVKIEASSYDELKAIVTGMLLGSYSFDRYKSDKSSKEIVLQVCIGSDLESKRAKSLIDEVVTICSATNYTRDLVNTPPDDMTPVDLAACAVELARESLLECSVYDEKFLEDEKMNAMLAVARASVHKPRLIHLSYRPKNAKKVITLVGKGLTYDSGGLSLKPSSSMVTMKMDKAGGCAVLGILKAVEALGLPVEVHGFVGAVENMIGANAYKPDDVLVAKNGKTIEVRNTDAEGRLVLADVLCYAQQSVKADYLFDFATLTGACMVALGQYTTGILGHSGNLKHHIRRASSDAGELAASLPFNNYLKDLLKSEIADMSNVGSKPYGGAITAALFLDNFIDDEMKQKWMHFDIAGSAYSESSWGVNPHGATGAGVRSCVEFIKGL